MTRWPRGDDLRKRGLIMGRGYADPSSPAQIATLCERGLPTQRAQGSVAGGIDQVCAALKVRGDGLPGPRVDAGCANLIREMESYTWSEGYAETEKQPEMRADHAVDALRYAGAWLRRTARMQVVKR